MQKRVKHPFGRKAALHIRPVLLAFCALIGLVAAAAVPPVPAAAAKYTVDSDVWADTKHPGKGTFVNQRLVPPGSDSADYYLLFDPWGEELQLRDMNTDGDRAVAFVRVFRGSYIIDEDDFYSGEPYKYYQLGTPDGTGDIDEGVTVEFKLCREGFQCTGWTRGRA